MRHVALQRDFSIEKLIARCARRDLPYHMESNGEWLVQDVELAGTKSRTLIVFDVGSNVGAWTQSS